MDAPAQVGPLLKPWAVWDNKPGEFWPVDQARGELTGFLGWEEGSWRFRCAKGEESFSVPAGEPVHLLPLDRDVWGAACPDCFRKWDENPEDRYD